MDQYYASGIAAATGYLSAKLSAYSENGPTVRMRRCSIVVFVFILVSAAITAYCKPILGGNWDTLAYIGSVQAFTTSDLNVIHSRTYALAQARIPAPEYRQLTHDDSNGYRQDMEANALHFAEKLPGYNIRIIFVELSYLLTRAGIPTISAMLMISCASYVLLGIVILLWLSLHLRQPWAALFALLIMISTPMMDLARSALPDMLSLLLVIAALYLGFEKHSVFGCALLLLVSIYVRSENAVLTVIVLAYFTLSGQERLRLRFAHAIILVATAVASYFVIMHCAGNYGWATLFHNSFVGSVKAPGEMVLRVTPLMYLNRLITGIVSVNSLTMFLPAGILGYLLLRKQHAQNRPLQALIVVVTLTMAVRYMLFPMLADRFFAFGYVVYALALPIGAAPLLGIAYEAKQQAVGATGGADLIRC